MPRNQSLGRFFNIDKCDFDLEKTFQLMKMFRQGCKGWKSFECTIITKLMKVDIYKDMCWTQNIKD